MNILCISDGEDSSGTYNLRGIKRFSINHMDIVQFYPSMEQMDWADIIYVHYGGIGKWKNLLAGLRRRQDKPWILGVRGFGNFKRCFEWIFEDKIYRPVWFMERAVAISCSNMELMKMVRKWTDIPTYLCQAGVDTGWFIPQGPPKDEFCIGWVGNPYSGDKMFSRLKDLPFSLKMAEGEILHREMPWFYRNIWVYVSVSQYEGCPMPPLEAAACGRPVVATRAGTLVEWVPEEYLIDNHLDMIPILEKLRDDRELYLRECKRFRKLSLKWDFEYIAEQYDFMFKSVI